MKTHTWSEITSQYEALSKTFEVMENVQFSNLDAHQITVFTGCGTSFYLAHSAAKYFQKTTGRMAVAVPASEIFMDWSSVFSNEQSYQLIAISRSGTTSEVVKAVEFVKENSNIQTLAITCGKESKMAKIAHQSIILNYIQEKSVVMTQSFSNMLFALQLYAVKIAGNDQKKQSLKQVPELSAKLLKDKEILKSLTANKDLNRYVFLGSNVFNGIAKEATLKLKEMTQTECESYSNLEFRHGPISIVDENTVVVVLSSDASEKYDKSLAYDIQEKGGVVVVFAKENAQIDGDLTVLIPSDLNSEELAVVYMPHLQLLAYYKAIALGLNPDQPRNLTQVVTLHF
jgi:glutamine---fructose-6-phosphate transaminase (isomerizing)